MGVQVSRDDFEWTDTVIVHTPRRLAILQKHPEIKKLMVYDHQFKWIVTCIVLFQFLSFWLLRDASWITLLVLAYCLGGVINHSLTLALHEIAHNMAFGYAYPTKNRLFGMFVNLPIGFPMSVSFKIYHLDHHKYQADDLFDPDLPSRFEAEFFCNSFTKIIWLILQPLFYLLRPLLVNPKKPTSLEMLNWIVQIAFNVLIYKLIGMHMIWYMIGGTLVSMGLHPMAGHFISEHYMFAKGFETYSYYGPMNAIAFNVGYHMEHHDFPNIPASLLPEVKRIAADFYDPLPQHNSWVKVLWDFITDPSIGPYARMRRKHLEEAQNIKEIQDLFSRGSLITAG